MIGTETEDGDTILPASAAALVANEDGGLDLMIPKSIAEGGDTPVPRHALLLASMLIKANNDPAWAEALIDEVFGAGDEEEGESEEDAPPSPQTGSEGRVEG